jgi:tetratricopeptide (TPR) repeat protein
VVRYSDNLASVLWRQGNYAQAERLLRWGLAIREKGLDEGDPLLAHSFQELAALEDDQGKYFEAELHWFQAARRSKQSRDLAGVVLALRKLGCLERRLGRFEEARQFLESALKAGDGIRDEQKAALLMDLGLKNFSGKPWAWRGNRLPRPC